MLKKSAALVVGSTIAFGPLVAPAGAAGPGDSITGGGITGIQTRFGLSARFGPHGPSGHAVFQTVPDAPERVGGVVCINVVGNRGVFGIRDEEPNGVVQYLIFYVEDLGEPRGGQPVDRIRGQATTLTPPPEDCGIDIPAAGTGNVLQHGNIRVTDG